MRADFGGADGALEDAGDFGEGEPLDAAEEQDLAVAAVEPAEGGVQEGPLAAAAWPAWGASSAMCARSSSASARGVVASFWK